jgi:phage virion morphogenesis protein
MISITLDDRAILAALAQLRDHARDLAPAFREIGSSLVDEIKLGFSAGRSPYGVAWKPLSPVTQAANKGRRRGGEPLRDTGKLMNSITYRLLGQNGVEVGTADFQPKAATHQFGSANAWGRGIRVPARPYLPAQGNTAVLPDAWRQLVLEILRDHLDLR